VAGGELNVIRHIPAVCQSRANPAARSLFAAVRKHGGQPRPLLKTGTSDMNTVSEHWPVPMAAYGPGDSTLDHGSDERILISEYLRGVAVLTSALDELEQDAGQLDRT
jgi:[amino group carrier protein]-lysine/ornithine hydrolase